MSISAVSGATSAAATTSPLSLRQQEDVVGRQLEQALQSGDLAGATQAYNKLAALGPNNSGPFTSPALKQDFAALGQALESGNLGAAQQAVNTLGNGLLAKDYQTVQRDYKAGGLQGAQQAISNLEGDYWAVTGQGNPVPQDQPAAASTSASQSAAAVNLQA